MAFMAADLEETRTARDGPYTPAARTAQVLAVTWGCHAGRAEKAACASRPNLKAKVQNPFLTQLAYLAQMAIRS